jgi:hypothetical protein
MINKSLENGYSISSLVNCNTQYCIGTYLPLTGELPRETNDKKLTEIITWQVKFSM